MNKKELVDFMYEELDMTKKSLESTVDTFFNGIRQGLVEDGKAQFVGFGSFKLVKRAARKGRNPQTGEELEIPETTVVKFTPAKALKELVRDLDLDSFGEEEDE